VVIDNLYFASRLTELFGDMAKAVNYYVTSYDGLFTSFLDSGNLFRGWLVELAQGNLVALLLLPVVLLLLVATWKVTRRA